jgi:hypothetical protein
MMKELPNLLSFGAQEEKVISVFVEGAGEAGGGSSNVVSEAPFVGGETAFSSKPAENFALQGGSAPPHLARNFVVLQLPERIGIETFVRKFFVSEAANAEVRAIVTQHNRSQLICKVTEFGFSIQREARSKSVAEIRSEGRADTYMNTSGMRVQGGEALKKRGISKPEISPEGRRGSITGSDSGDGAKSLEPRDNILPDWGIEVMAIAKVARRAPSIHAAKPASPRSSGVRVKFGEELGEKSRVLGTDRDHTEPPQLFRDAHLFPGHQALTPIASLFPSPKEGAAPFVNSLYDSRREQARTHGMGEHRGEDGVDKNQPSTNGKASAPPTREAQITFCNNGGKVIEAELVGRERKSKVGLGEGGDFTAKSRSHGESVGVACPDWDEGAFVEVDGKPSSSREIVQDTLQISHMLRNSADDDEGVIGVLEDRARKVVDQGV